MFSAVTESALTSSHRRCLAWCHKNQDAKKKKKKGWVFMGRRETLVQVKNSCRRGVAASTTPLHFHGSSVRGTGMCS